MALYSVFYSEACFCLSQNKTRSKTDNDKKKHFGSNDPERYCHHFASVIVGVFF